MTGPAAAPIDVLLVEFPPGARDLDAESARELTALADVGVIRVLETKLVERGDDGTVTAQDAEAFGPCRRVAALGGEHHDLISDEEVERLARGIEPGRIAALVVWENLWVEPLAESAAAAGGRLVVTSRIEPGSPHPDPRGPIDEVVVDLSCERDASHERTVRAGFGAG